MGKIPEFTLTYFTFFAAIFSIGFICGCSRYLRNGDYLSIQHCLTVGLFSACCCVGVDLLLIGYNLIPYTTPSVALGVAFILGLSAKEQVDLLGYAWRVVKGWIHIRTDFNNNDDSKSKNTK